jgi:CRP-like cAMP-binding protein
MTFITAEAEETGYADDMTASTRNRRKAALRRVQFLKALPDDVLDAIARSGTERRLNQGELLFGEHDRCLGLIVVLAGAIKVYKMDGRGRELTLDREMPGESVFELPLFDGGNYPASAEAAEANTVVYVVPRDTFGHLLTAHPQIATGALRALAIRTRKLIQMVEAHSLHSVRARLAAYLLTVAASNDEFTLAETNEAIGSRIGTVREVVSRTLHSFKDAGVIHICGRRVQICDETALRRLAGIDAPSEEQTL